jgi:hypothetical protein
MDDSTYRRIQLSQKRKNKVDYGICSICGESNPEIMKQAHHIFGNKISDETTILCLNHHCIATAEQNKLSPNIRSCKTKNHKRIFMLRSIGALLKIIGEKLIELSEDLEVEENENNKQDK